MTKQKRLLILGGSRYVIPAIKAAHSLGHYVITCDYLPENPGHKFADEYHNVSIVEKDAVLELAKQLKVDGILSYATDPGVEPAAWVCEKLGLPTPPYESVRILQNKALFRKFLAEHGFNVPKAKGYFSYEEAAADFSSFTLPVIVKPVDSAGSKGVTRVDSADELKNAVEYALSYSLSKQIIIENFIVPQSYPISADCFSIDGKLVFCPFDDQLFDVNASNPYTPAGCCWPSSMSADKLSELESELQRLIGLLHMGTTIYNIEARVGIDGVVYIMEVSPRAGGNRLAEIVRLSTGQDMITNAVNAALGDSVGEFTEPRYDGVFAEYMLHADTAGVFSDLLISDELKPYVVERDLWVNAGDEVHAFTGANESIGTLVMRFPSQDVFERLMKDIKMHVSIVVSPISIRGGEFPVE